GSGARGVGSSAARGRGCSAARGRTCTRGQRRVASGGTTTGRAERGTARGRAAREGGDIDRRAGPREASDASRGGEFPGAPRQLAGAARAHRRSTLGGPTERVARARARGQAGELATHRAGQTADLRPRRAVPPEAVTGAEMLTSIPQRFAWW